MTTASTTAVTRREPELSGQTVIIIGGSAGIGLETARWGPRRGAEIILAARRPDQLRQAAADVGADGTAASTPLTRTRSSDFSPGCPRRSTT